MKESLASYNRLQTLIKESLSKQPKKGYGCGCTKCKEKANNNKKQRIYNI